MTSCRIDFSNHKTVLIRKPESSSANDLLWGTATAAAAVAAATAAATRASYFFTISSQRRFASSSAATSLALASSSAAASSASSFRRVRSKIRLVYSCISVGCSCVPGTWIVADDSGVEELVGGTGLLQVSRGIVVSLQALAKRQWLQKKKKSRSS